MKVLDAIAHGIGRSVNDWEPDDGAYDLARAAYAGLVAGNFAVIRLADPDTVEHIRNALIGGSYRADAEAVVRTLRELTVAENVSDAGGGST
jgi:hypothetical protein